MLIQDYGEIFNIVICFVLGLLLGSYSSNIYVSLFFLLLGEIIIFIIPSKKDILKRFMYIIIYLLGWLISRYLIVGNTFF